MITIKSPREIEDMAKSGAILAGMHVALRDIIKYAKTNGYTFAKITMDTPMVTHRVNN